jgi:hypothetical protein
MLSFIYISIGAFTYLTYKFKFELSSTHKILYVHIIEKVFIEIIKMN